MNVKASILYATRMLLSPHKKMYLVKVHLLEGALLALYYV